MDVDSLRREHDKRVLDQLLSDRLVPADLQRRLAHFHRGDPPCAVYSENSDTSEEEVQSIRRELTSSGLLGKVREASSVLWRWGDEDEKWRHGPITDDEIVASWNETANAFERVVAMVAPSKLAHAVRENVKMVEDAELKRGDDQVARLSEAERAALRATWVRHPRALSFPALIRTVSRLREDAVPHAGDPSTDVGTNALADGAATVTCLNSIASRAGDKPDTVIVYFTLPKGQTVAKGQTLRCAPPTSGRPCTVLDIVDNGMIEALCPR